MRNIVYALVFCITLHSTLALYTNSTYLATYFSDEGITLAYVASALATIGALFSANRLAKRFGATRLTVAAGLAEAAALIGIAFVSHPIVLILCFVAIQALTAILFYTFDVFLEAYSSNSSTGGVRGMFLTIINAAFLVGPLLGTQIIARFGFIGVYLTGAALVAGVALCTAILFAHFKDPKYDSPHLSTIVRAYHTKQELLWVTLAFLSLWLFYVIAIVYAPIYLTHLVGLTTQHLGYVLAIGLLPFVLIQIPLGRLADSSFGEKEFMFFGFFLMVISSFFVPYTATLGIIALVATIFVGRIGAASAEVMCDTYFFKHVDATDTGTIATYRSMMYVAYACVPLFMLPLISAHGYAITFPVAGVFALLGIPFVLTLRDTK